MYNNMHPAVINHLLTDLYQGPLFLSLGQLSPLAIRECLKSVNAPIHALGDLQELSCRFIGSVCVPDSNPQDLDVLVLFPTKEALKAAVSNLLFFGFTNCADGSPTLYPGDWCALRKGTLNFVFTTDASRYYELGTAARISAGLKLVNKTDRIKLYEAIRGERDIREVLAVRT